MEKKPERKNILLLTMVISPSLGSEYSVAWNYVKFMSKYHNLHVLYEASSNIIGDASEMKEFLKLNSIENVTFHHVQPGKAAGFIYSIKDRFKRFYYARYILYISFKLWHGKAYKYAKELIKEQDFDVVHFLSPIGYREPSHLWKLDLPYIRGPVGGTYQKPLSLFKAIRPKERIIFYIRNVFNWLQLRLSVPLRRSLRHTDVLLTTTSRVQADFKKVHNKDSILLPENSVSEVFKVNYEKFKSINKCIEIVWVGRVDGNKALIILLEALVLTRKRNFKLHVVGGDSNMSKQCKLFVSKNNIQDNVVFHGKVPREKVFDFMDKSHLHVISSLSEGHPTTQWEAMAVGLPTMTLDHCGMADVINEKSGIKIPITSYNGTVKKMSEELLNVLENPQHLVSLAETTIKEAEKYSWEERVNFFNELYSRF